MSGHMLYYGDPLGVETLLNDQVQVFLARNGLRGFGAVRSDVPAEQRPYADGVARTGGPYAPARTLEVGLKLVCASYGDLVGTIDALRRKLSPYKNRSNPGYLRVTTADGRSRKIDCFCVHPIGDIDVRGAGTAVVTVEFWAEYPYFYDPTPQSQQFSLGSAAGILFEADYLLSPLGVEYTSGDINTTLNCANAGDVESAPTIRINGPGQNPKVGNHTTGEEMQLTAGGGLTMDSGDYVLFSMATPDIQWWDASAGQFYTVLSKMSSTSVFWKLRPGDNEIHVEMANSETGTAQITWYKYYLSGV